MQTKLPLVMALEDAIDRSQNKTRVVERYEETYSSYYPSRSLDRSREDVIYAFEDLVRKLARYGFELALVYWKKRRR